MGSEKTPSLTAAQVLNNMSREDAIAALARITRGFLPT